MWQDISTAPFGCDLQLAVIDADGERPIAFRCRRVVGGWIEADKNRRIDLRANALARVAKGLPLKLLQVCSNQ
jgi:hypothetical protein